MEKEPPVSIIMPAFEIEKTEEAIRHILKQDYKKMDVIVVNDNPKIDISNSMLKFIETNKIKLVNNPVNLGIAYSLNEGIKASQSEVIAIICRDYFPENNQWLTNVIKKLYSDEKIACVISPIVWPVEVWKKYNFKIRLLTFRHIAKPQYGGGNYKKKIFEKVGLFNGKKYTFAGEDCDMHAKIKKIGYRIEHVEDSITHRHYDNNSKIKDVLKKEYRYGKAHGALKKEYGLIPRIGLFDFEIRLLFLLGFILSFLFFNQSIALLFLIPFFIASLVQTIKSYKRAKWLPGLLLYPFVGIIIFVVQTIGSVNGYLMSKYR